jgi:hypothetical protein
MHLKIICFEDEPSCVKDLKASFIEKKHKIEFRAYDLKEDWDETSKRAKEITEFNPDLAVVDLADQKGSGERTVGFRIIRKLKELQVNSKPRMNEFPVIAWSRFLSDTDAGNTLKQRAKAFSAIPIFKPRRKRYNVAEMLRKAGLSG